MGDFDYIKSPVLRAVAEGDRDRVRALAAAGESLDVSDSTVGGPLNLAITNDDPQMLALLLELKADPNQVCKNHDRPLAAAATRHDLRATELLLQYGAKVNAIDRDGQSALGAAVALDDLKIARRLIEAGADVLAKNKYGVSALSMVEMDGSKKMRELIQGAARQAGSRAGLADAAKLGDLARVNELLPRASAEEKLAAAHAAVKAGSSETLRALLAAGVDPNARCPHESIHRPADPLLIFAIEADSEAAVEALIEAGADVNARCQVNQVGGSSPLISAITGPLAIVKRLLAAGADPQHRDAAGNSALSTAKHWGKKQVIAHLEKVIAAAPVAAAAPAAAPRLFDAVRDGLADAVEACLAAGSDVNRTNGKGDTPLKLACELGHVEVVRRLLARGADVSVLNKHGLSAWEVAMRGRAPAEIAPLLLAAADPIEKLLGPTADASRRKDLWTAALWSDRPTVIVPLLLSAGLDVNARLGEEETPLSIAIESNSKDVVKVLQLLLDAGAETNVSLAPAGSALSEEQLAELERQGLPTERLRKRAAPRSLLDLAKESSSKAYKFLRERLALPPDAYDRAAAELKELPAAAEAPAFQALAVQVDAVLKTKGKPWKKRAGVTTYTVRLPKVFGLSKDSTDDDEYAALAAIRAEARAAGATLITHARSFDNRNLTTLLLFPTTSYAAILRGCGTSGGNQWLSVRPIVEWFAAKEASHPFVVLGAGHDFVEVEFATPITEPRKLLAALAEFCSDFEFDEHDESEENVATVEAFAASGRCFLWWD